MYKYKVQNIPEYQEKNSLLFYMATLEQLIFTYPTTFFESLKNILVT